MKTCTKCGEEKPLDKFNRRKLSADGLESRCRDCARAYYVANRARALERNAAWYVKNRERVLQQQAEYVATNYDKVQARRAGYRSRNPEKIREYQAANPHHWWESNYRKRAAKFGFEAMVIPFTREELIARYGDACHHCGGPFEHLDHYPVPVALGGAHSLDNCVPSCATCNTAQAARIRSARPSGA